MANKHISTFTFNATVQTNDFVLNSQPNANEPDKLTLVRSTPKQFERLYRDFLTSWFQNNPFKLRAPLKGLGTADNPLTADPIYFEERFVQKTSVDITQIGDGVTKYLPVSGSYFSVNWPSNTRWWGGAAFLEPNGDLEYLAPVTNGVDIRYTYNTYVGWASGQFKHVNNDIVYTLLQLPPTSWVSEILGASASAMVIEYTHEDGTIGHGFVETNGTFDYVEHRLIDLGRALFDEFPGSDSNRFTRRAPTGCIVDGKRYIFVPDNMSRFEPIVLRCYFVSETGVLTELLNWTVNTGFSGGVRNTSQIRLTEGIHGDENGLWGEIVPDPDFVMHNSTLAADKRTFLIQLAQSGSRLRLQLTKTHGCTYVPANQGTANIDLHYTFDITFNANAGGRHTCSTVPLFRNVKYHLHAQENNAVAFRLSEPVDGLEIIAASISRDTFQRLITNLTHIRHPIHPAADSNHASIFVRSTKSAYDQLDGREVYRLTPTAGSPANTPLKPPFTPLRNPMHCWFLQDPVDTGVVGANVHRGKMLAYNSGNRGLPGSSWPVVLADIRGAIATRYPLITGDPSIGFELNNDRLEVESPRNLEISKSVFTYARVPPNQVTPNFGTMPIYYSRAFFANQRYTVSESMDYEFNYDLEVLSTLSVEQSFIDQWYALLNTKWPEPEHFYSWIMGVAPTAAGKRLTFNLAVRRIEDGYTLREHGHINVLTTVSGKHHKLVGIVPESFAYIHRAAAVVIPVHDNLSDILSYTGVAMMDVDDDMCYLTMKEAFTTTNYVNSGGGRPGLPLMRLNKVTNGIQYLGELNGRTTASNVYAYPTITRVGGLGIIDAAVAGNTHYEFQPKVLDYAPFKEPYILTSMSPAKGFFINILENIPIVMGGIEVVIPPQSIDIRKQVWAVENRTIYLHAQIINGVVHLRLTTQFLNESDKLALLATIVTTKDSISSIDAKPVFRIGTWRVSDAPAGSAIPVTSGQRSAAAASWWSTRRYP